METVDSRVGIVLAYLTHGLIIAAMGGVVSLLIRSVSRASHPYERLLRGMGILVGLLITLTARVVGMSLADFIGASLALAMPIAFLVRLLFPAAMGFFLAWFMTYNSRRNEVVATRILVFVGTLVVSQFADVYLFAVRSAGFTLSPYLLPNTSFLAAVTIYMMLKAETPKWAIGNGEGKSSGK